ncbi:MAG TPA: UDP-N-acetylenolpyruvoylglucosamine reductase [Clostridiales bacterium]|jgi:UDP-N-acetylmuramate dehydrogenase|nr:UDP-N-acetylenolpyruvoylglucosamine reductase [Clostridiales bacterium]
MIRLYHALKHSINGTVYKDYLIKDNTYFKIGGSVDLFVEPENEEELASTLAIIGDSISFYIIGNGTNLLFSDRGYRGAVIKIGNYFNGIKIEENKISVGAGTLLSLTAKAAAENELKGMEFASGIPGYIGGAVAMNAGAYGGEMVNIVKTVRCMDYNGNIFNFSNDEMEFEYRNSRVFKNNLIVLSAELELEKGNKDEIYDRINYLAERRRSNQPLDKPSAGSTFKRPTEGFAAKLIEDSGLKGLRYRGAMVSDKHSGFVINDNNAKADDVLSLMRIVRETVFQKFGILLEPEVKIIGEEF